MTTDHSTEEALASIQTLMKQSDFPGAIRALDLLLASDPDNEQALYLLAVSERFQKQFEKAREALDRLFRLSPEFGRGYQELGHLHRDQGALQPALEAYRLAVRYNPSLTASWTWLGQLAARAGDEETVRLSEQQLNRLKNLPKPLIVVTDYLSEGKLLKAEDLCRAFLKKVPHHVEAMRLLADIGARLGVLEDAEFLLESAIALEPDNIQLRLDYIQVLRKRQKFEAAFKEAEALVGREPDNPLFLSHLAIEAMQLGDHVRALSLFDKVLARLPDDPATLVSRGHALKTIGDNADAIETYRRALALHGSSDAAYALANLKTYSFPEDEIGAMVKLLEKPGLPRPDEINLSFALGKAMEDAGDPERAMSFYVRGNGLKRAQSRYDADQMTEELEAQTRVCKRSFFAERQGFGANAKDPIFVVGLPRAGSTLLEQILASHPQVDGTLELPDILSLSQRLRRREIDGQKPGYPTILEHLTADDCATFGQDYLEATAVHRQGAPRFVDKMPNNFRHIGLIHLILPNAKIIDARRHPLDCCFSGFKQLFAEGQEFTYGLKEVGQYYRDYVALMAHWDEVLPGKVLRVQYEKVVADLEHEVRRLLDFCDLPFDAACVNFHETERSVRTASSEQVRQPLYQSGVDQWRPFEPWLGPLKSALGPALTEY